MAVGNLKTLGMGINIPLLRGNHLRVPDYLLVRWATGDGRVSVAKPQINVRLSSCELIHS